MTFGQFLSILRARWWVVLLVLGLTVATTVVVSLLLPKQYTATASVVVDFKPDPISAAVFGGMPSPAVMATQVDILTSERVALRVVQANRLSENPQIRQQWQDETGGEGTVEQWLITLFQKSLDVQPSRESSVIRVGYQAPDPRFAAGMANAFVQAYVDTSLALRVNPARQYSGFFDQQVKDSREALEKAQSRLSAFQRANGIIATDERLDVENARLNELSSQLVALQAVAAESRSRQAQANSAAGDRIQEVLANPVINQLKADITRAEVQIKQLTARLGEAHPQVVEARGSLAELRSRLDAETRRVTGGVTVTSTINTQREAQVRAALEAQRAQVLRMKTVRDEGLVLQREVENAQRTYDAVQARLAQSSLESQTTQSNVNVLTQAVPPLEPSSPNIPLNVALSVFLGGLLAVGTALLLELMDRRVRSVDDVIAALDLPVIGVLPKPGAKRWSAGKALPMQQRLMPPLPPAAKEA
ncbi:chain length determinant protein EpsF [Rubrivivax albus]|uniref:Chain length determinant protein EpsF n=1 Tax=Rubrivivax albus TaxID=2499835 RepID=A0A3S2URY2_9BURK|nr:chain length determinant protein EpsF [Rubrivivax albus]RVT53663.1 chain length determinant protein EpsF [Rubrivivax albus]